MTGAPTSMRDRLVLYLEVHDQSDLDVRRLPSPLSLPTSRPGIVAALVLGGLTLLPSMLPKSATMEGIVLGVDFVLGYALGVVLQWAWRFLELPVPEGPRWTIVLRAWYGIVGVLLLVSLWRHVGWQNDIRRAFGMPETAPTVWLRVLPIALLVAAVLLVLARLVRIVFYRTTRWLDRRLPGRTAVFLGGLVFAALAWGLWTQVLVDGFFMVANGIAAPTDASTDDGIAQPDSSLRSGSPASLVSWETLGRKGRTFVASGPTVEELDSFNGGGALEPIRVYVGLGSAPTAQERAELLLRELVRTDAFDREVLVIAATTGTGIVGPRSMEALEYLLNGDVAVAGVQYSYLPSAVSLLADLDEVRTTAHVTFDTIHEYWSTLDEDSRPAIHLYGLSLGAYGVEEVLTSIDIVNEPVDGALLVGPPFFNPLHGRLVADRDPGSTWTAPVHDDGRTVRFHNDEGPVPVSGDDWGPTRIVYVQHTNDPVVTFSLDLLFRRPAWLDEGRANGVLSDEFRWVPIISMWQVLTDMAGAGAVAEGYGHMYSAAEHVVAWASILDPGGRWDDQEIERLRAHLIAEAEADGRVVGGSGSGTG